MSFPGLVMLMDEKGTPHLFLLCGFQPQLFGPILLGGGKHHPFAKGQRLVGMESGAATEPVFRRNWF